MTWSYVSPSDSEKDAVRFLLGDTDPDDELIQDEEINFLLDERQDRYHAAADAAEQIAGRFTREVNQSADGLSWSGSSLSQQFFELATKLRAQGRRARRSGFAPYAGGLSKHEREMDNADQDLYKGHFSSHMHDNQRAEPQDDLRPKQ